MEYLVQISSYNKSKNNEAEATKGDILDENLPALFGMRKTPEVQIVSANSKRRNDIDTHKLITKNNIKVKQGRKIIFSNCFQSYEVKAFKCFCKGRRFNVHITINPSSDIYPGNDLMNLKKRRQWIERYLSSLIRSVRARGRPYKAIKVYERFENELLHVHVLASISEDDFDLLENRSGLDKDNFRQFRWDIVRTVKDLNNLSSYLMKGRKHFGPYEARFENRTDCRSKKGHRPVPGFSRISASKKIKKAWKHCLKAWHHRHQMQVQARSFRRECDGVKN